MSWLSLFHELLKHVSKYDCFAEWVNICSLMVSFTIRKWYLFGTFCHTFYSLYKHKLQANGSFPVYITIRFLCFIDTKLQVNDSFPAEFTFLEALPRTGNWIKINRNFQELRPLYEQGAKHSKKITGIWNMCQGF